MALHEDYQFSIGSGTNPFSSPPMGFEPASAILSAGGSAVGASLLGLVGGPIGAIAGQLIGGLFGRGKRKRARRAAEAARKTALENYAFNNLAATFQGAAPSQVPASIALPESRAGERSEMGDALVGALKSLGSFKEQAVRNERQSELDSLNKLNIGSQIDARYSNAESRRESSYAAVVNALPTRRQDQEL